MRKREDLEAAGQALAEPALDQQRGRAQQYDLQRDSPGGVLIPQPLDRTEGERFRVGIQISAGDRLGLLKDLTAALADAGVDITAVRSEAREGHARLAMLVQVGDLDQLARALARLERLPGVDSARRSAG